MKTAISILMTILRIAGCIGCFLVIGVAGSIAHDNDCRNLPPVHGKIILACNVNSANIGLMCYGVIILAIIAFCIIIGQWAASASTP